MAKRAVSLLELLRCESAGPRAERPITLSFREVELCEASLESVLAELQKDEALTLEGDYESVSEGGSPS